MVAVVPPNEALIEALAASMRPEDAAEVRASAGMDPLRAIRASLEASAEAHFVIIEGGEVLAAFGVTPRLADGTRAVWALTAAAVDRHRLSFWRASKDCLAALLVAYPEPLFNFVDQRYVAAQRWLRRLGFRQIGPPMPFGVEQREFVLMEIPGEGGDV